MKIVLMALLMGILVPHGRMLGQPKVEREYRIGPEEVPKRALALIESLGFAKKVKWYREEGLGPASVEAKTSHEGSRHSIEFDTQGNLEDIEVEVGWHTIPPPVRNNICRQFKSDFNHHRINKTQIQFTGETDVLVAHFHDPSALDGVTIRYEIVANGKTDQGRRLWEYLFDREGKTLSKAVIVFRNTDNLEY